MSSLSQFRGTQRVLDALETVTGVDWESDETIHNLFQLEDSETFVDATKDLYIDGDTITVVHGTHTSSSILQVNNLSIWNGGSLIYSGETIEVFGDLYIATGTITCSHLIVHGTTTITVAPIDEPRQTSYGLLGYENYLTCPTIELHGTVDISNCNLKQTSGGTGTFTVSCYNNLTINYSLLISSGLTLKVGGSLAFTNVQYNTSGEMSPIHTTYGILRTQKKCHVDVTGKTCTIQGTPYTTRSDFLAVPDKVALYTPVDGGSGNQLTWIVPAAYAENLHMVIQIDEVVNDTLKRYKQAIYDDSSNLDHSAFTDEPPYIPSTGNVTYNIPTEILTISSTYRWRVQARNETAETAETTSIFSDYRTFTYSV